MTKAQEINDKEEYLRYLINTFIYGDVKPHETKKYLNNINAYIIEIKKIVTELKKEETFFDEPTDKEQKICT